MKKSILIVLAILVGLVGLVFPVPTFATSVSTNVVLKSRGFKAVIQNVWVFGGETVPYPQNPAFKKELYTVDGLGQVATTEQVGSLFTSPSTWSFANISRGSMNLFLYNGVLRGSGLMELPIAITPDIGFWDRPILSIYFTFRESSRDPVTGLITAYGSWQVIGGTGKYIDTTGNGTWTCTFVAGIGDDPNVAPTYLESTWSTDQPQGPKTMVLTGTLSEPSLNATY